MSVIMEVIHTIKPLTPMAFDEYVQAYQELSVPGFEKHGWELLGAWKFETGPMGRDLLLVRFESMKQMNAATASLGGDTAFQKRVGLAMLGGGKQIGEQPRLCHLTPYSSEERLKTALESSNPKAPRTYWIARLTVPLGQHPRAYEVVSKLVEGVEKGPHKLAIAYEADFGPRGEITHIWSQEGPPLVGYSAGRGTGREELFGALREAAPEESIDLLTPLPYSPLQ